MKLVVKEPIPVSAETRSVKPPPAWAAQLAAFENAPTRLLVLTAVFSFATLVPVSAVEPGVKQAPAVHVNAAAETGRLIATGTVSSGTGTASAEVLFQQGMKLREQERWKQAYDFIVKAHQLEPRNGDYLHRLIECQVSLSQLSAAKVSLSKLRNADPKHAFLPYLECFVPWCSDEFEPALAAMIEWDRSGHFDHSLEMYVDVDTRVLARLKQYATAGEAAKAHHLLELMYRLKPNSKVLPVLCGDLATSRNSRAVHTLIGGPADVANSNRSPSLLCQLLVCLQALEEDGVTEAWMRLVERFHGDSSVTQSPLCLVAYRNLYMTDRKAASKFVDSLLKQMPEGEMRLRLQALVYADRKRPDDALACYAKALSRQSHSPEVLFERGSLFMHLYQGERALADFNQAIKEAPGNGGYYLQRARCYRDLLLEPELARADVKRARKLLGDSTVAALISKAAALRNPGRMQPRAVPTSGGAH